MIKIRIIIKTNKKSQQDKNLKNPNKNGKTANLRPKLIYLNQISLKDNKLNIRVKNPSIKIKVKNQ